MKSTKTRETAMFDHDTLYNSLYTVIKEEIPNFSPGKVEHIVNRLCGEVSEWVPKHGDYWLTDDGVLYVNKGWGVVCAGAFE